MPFPWDSSQRNAAIAALDDYNTNYRLNLPAGATTTIVNAVADADPRNSPPAPNVIIANLSASHGWGLSAAQSQSAADVVTTALG